MEIYSESGYLIIMDPHFLQLGNDENISKIDFLKRPNQAARTLEKELFPEGGSDKIGLIVLNDGPGKYCFDATFVSYWDVENEDMSNRTIFGVELGSYIIFDIEHIGSLVKYFDLHQLEKLGEEPYFKSLNEKLTDGINVILWQQSHVGIGDGWHEVDWQGFTKC